MKKVSEYDQEIPQSHAAAQSAQLIRQLPKTTNRVDPSTNLVFSKLDSFSLDSLSLFIQIENSMQIKRGGNVPDNPPLLKKNHKWL